MSQASSLWCSSDLTYNLMLPLFWFFFSLAFLSSLPVTRVAVLHVCRTTPLLIISTPNTYLGIPAIINRGCLKQEEVGNEHFLSLLLKISYSIEKDPARESRREGASGAVAW